MKAAYFILFVIPFLILTTNSLGYYERNIARKSYWLLENNLFRLNGTHGDFWEIINNESLTKKQILLKLGKWTESTKSPYMIDQFERMVNYEKQLYKIAEEFNLELVHSQDATKLAKELYEIHQNLDLTWKQTCREKNQKIRLAEKAIQDELKLQLNSWCIPKPKTKRSALLK